MCKSNQAQSIIGNLQWWAKVCIHPYCMYITYVYKNICLFTECLFSKIKELKWFFKHSVWYWNTIRSRIVLDWSDSEHEKSFTVGGEWVDTRPNLVLTWPVGLDLDPTWTLTWPDLNLTCTELVKWYLQHSIF